MGETRAQAGKSAAEAKKFAEKKTDYWEALQEYVQERAYPNDRIDTLAYWRAIEQRDAMPVGSVGGGRLGGGLGLYGAPLPPPGVPGGATWEYVGPKKLGIPYVDYYGPSGSSLGGRIGGLAFSPIDTNTMYAAMPAGGVWKTADGGTTWAPISSSFAVPYCSSVAVSPANDQLVLVGMGDYDGGVDQGLGRGIMRSTDGGATWTNVGSAMNGLSVGNIVFHPDNPNVVLASSNGGIYRSADAGLTWARVQAGNFVSLSAGASDGLGNRFLYAGYNGTLGVLRSADAGATWTSVTLSPVAGTSQRYLVAASATDYNTVYLTRTSNRTTYQGVRNPGTDTYVWTDISTGFPNGNASLGTNYNWSQQSYDSYIKVAAQTVGGVVRDVVYVGLITTAAWNGTTWTDFGQTYTSTAKTHNDQHCIAIFPGNQDRMAIGNDGGVYGVTYTAGATNPWAISANLNDTIYATMFYHADFHPYDPTRMVGGTQDNASPVALGNLSAWSNAWAGDGCGCAISPVSPSLFFTTSQQNGVYRYDGFSRTSIAPTMTGERIPFVTRIGLDPKWPNPLYLGTDYLHRYDPNTRAWTTKVGAKQFSTTSTLRSIVVAPTDSRRIYVGVSDGQFYTSGDFGANWTLLRNFSRAVTDVSVSPTNPTDVLVTVSGTGAGHLWRCANTAATTPAFTDLSGAGATGLPNVAANSVTRDWRAPNTDFFVGSDIGVFSTTDGGVSWTNVTLPLGLPNCQVNTVRALPGTGFLMAATFGRGIYRLKLADPAPPAPVSLTTTVTFARTGSAINATVTVKNEGPGTANNTLLTVGRLTATSSAATTTATPVSFGTIAPRLSVSRTISFPLTVGAASVRGIFSASGVHDTGSFNAALRVTLP